MKSATGGQRGRRTKRESRGVAGAEQVLSSTFTHKQEGGGCGRAGRWEASGGVLLMWYFYAALPRSAGCRV